MIKLFDTNFFQLRCNRQTDEFVLGSWDWDWD